MRTKSFHLKGIFKKKFLRSEGAHPPQTPLSKELLNKNTTLFKKKEHKNGQVGYIKTKFYQKWALKNIFLHLNAHFHYFLQFWGSTSPFRLFLL